MLEIVEEYGVRVPTAMAIAGSDSGGGAGLQADLKSFAANGVYGTSAVTAVTSQNTLGVHKVIELPVDFVESQIDAIITDMGADAVKTGMLSSSEIISSVSRKLIEHKVDNIVVDPVMKAKGGADLINPEAVETLKETLIPMASVVTPNAPEAFLLTGITVVDLDSARDAAVRLVEMGASATVVKGGHFENGPATDVFYDGENFKLFSTKRINTRNTHGTGCTFASATAAGLAIGKSLQDAVSDAKSYVTGAIRYNFSIGKGHGPLNHFYRYWNKSDPRV